MVEKGNPGFKGRGKPAIELKVTEDNELMKFLLAQLPQKNRNNIKSLLRDRQVLVEDEVITQYNHQLKAGQRVKIRWEKQFSGEKALRGITIIFEDNYIIVVDKHAGILSVSTERKNQQTAYSILSSYVKTINPSNKIFIVHRLDRETSGVMLFAKSEKVQQLFQDSWHKIITEKTYLALTEGSVDPDEGVVESFLKENKAMIVYSTKDNDGQRAVTRYEVLKKNENFSLLKVNPETGRKNQIRVHMKDIRHSIVGDKKYGSNVNPIGRLGLHAWILAFEHPVTKEQMRFESKIPRRFERLF